MTNPLRVIPDPPRRRWTVLCGTTSWREWLGVVSGVAGGDDDAAISAFESAAASATGAAHGVAFGAGRMALHAAIDAVGLCPGDEVILPGFTCSVVPNAFLYRGVRPIYADIDDARFNVLPEAVEAAITPRTRAIYAQHTFGVSCDVGALRRIADARGLTLIEDLAHSLGGTARGRAHGAWGDVAFFSTDRSKVINSHIGGCALTSDPELAKRLRSAQAGAARLPRRVSRRIALAQALEHVFTHPDLFWLGRPALGALRRAGLEFQWRDEGWDSLPEGYPYPCGLPPAQARIALRQLERLGEMLAHRRAVAHRFEESLGWFGLAPVDRFEDHAWLRYSFLVEDRAAVERRMRGRFDLGIWFPHPIFGREGTADAVGYRAGSCPTAERVCRHIVNFPTHPRFTQRDCERVLERDGEWLRAQRIEPLRPPRAIDC